MSPTTDSAKPPMTLAQALRLVSENPPQSASDTFQVALVCGFTPLHLQTFLTASLRRRMPAHHVTVSTGMYEDIAGTLRTAAAQRLDAIVLVIEWADLDPRLGFRRSGGWSPRSLPNIIEQVRMQLAHVEQLVAEAAVRSPLVLLLPTLPLPPLFPTAEWQSSSFEAQLRASIASFAERVSSNPRVRLVNDQKVNAVAPASARLDMKALLAFGFPYQTPFAAHVAGILAEAVENRAPKKGLITDLDDTLWGGIVGDDGAAGVSWDLEHHTQGHALYQQLLDSLAEAGVLVGVASKNDPAVVDEAFARPDLLLSKARVFPIAVSWASKAQAVGRVLKAWNVHAESVVFVDDSATEIAEVQAAHPAMECVLFSAEPAAVFDLLRKLRDEFGRRTITSEDEIRLESLRQQSAIDPGVAAESAGYSETLLASSQATLSLVFSQDADDARALELVNKTNQFNLNGKRFTSRAWADYLSDPSAFLLSAVYTDRFGALGKIAVLAGRVNGDHAHIDTWVMSCRAFARRVEHQCLKALFERWPISTIRLDYVDTTRNGPLGRFLDDVAKRSDAGMVVTKSDFEAACPPLYHTVLVTDGVEHERCARTTG